LPSPAQPSTSTTNLIPRGASAAAAPAAAWNIATSAQSLSRPTTRSGSGGYGEWNADARLAFATNWSAGLGVYNILNRHANAAEFWYVDRLRGEPMDGIPDLHVHPLEPLAVRLTLSKTF
jgi:TonB dependent receptor